jgi:hypothetical protein
MCAAKLLNRQIQLLGGESAWMVPLNELMFVNSTSGTSASRCGGLPNVPQAKLERMSVAELTAYVCDLRGCLFPFQESTLEALLAVCEVAEMCDVSLLAAPAMRRQWSAIEASLLNLLAEEMAIEARDTARMALHAIRQKNLPYRISNT